MYISLVYGTAREKGAKLTTGKHESIFLEEVHFFQEDLFEFWFLEQPSGFFEKMRSVISQEEERCWLDLKIVRPVLRF